jgi:hypothetical protein
MQFSSSENTDRPINRPESSLKTYSFVTFFDSGYLSRGLALIESIRKQGDSSLVLVVCMDEQTYKLLSSKAEELNLKCRLIGDLVEAFPELFKAKANRSTIEFYFTLTPFVLKLALLDKPQDHVVLYLDADLYFFESPLFVVESLDTSSVALIKHNYPWFLRRLEAKYGTYNVGLLAFKNDEDGNRVLKWWALKCIEWCRDYPEKGKYADQGYLDNFAALTNNIQVLSNPGFNLAPWNSSSRRLRLESSRVSVNRNNLTFFHFHGLKHVGRLWISSQLNYFSPMARKIFVAIYGNYVNHLKTLESQYDLNRALPAAVTRKGFGLIGVISNAARTMFRVLSIVAGQAIHDKKIKESVT